MTEPLALLREPVYERQEGESRQAFQAFVAYRDLGPRRTKDDAYREYASRNPRVAPEDNGPSRARHASGRWGEWAARWRWPERAVAWDDHLDAEARSAEEAVVRRHAEELAEQRRAQRGQELELGSQLLTRAREMLSLPVVDVTTERDTATGRVTQHFHAAKWRLGDAAAIARIGVELRRLGLDMETSRAAVRVDIEDEIRRMARDNGWDEDAAVRAALQFAEERGDRSVG